MGGILIAALLLAFLRLMSDEWPFRGWLTNGINLGLIAGVFYLPVLPALFIWQKRASRRPEGAPTKVIVALVLCYLLWLGVLAVTVGTIFSALGF
jgi:hypothetical protein